MCLFIAGFCKLCHAFLNSRASLVFAWFNIFIFFKSNLSFSVTCFAGRDRVSSHLMAFLCSVMRDLMVFDVSPMYTFSQSWHGIWYTSLFAWSFCLLKRDLILFVDLCATFKLYFSSILAVISEILLVKGRVIRLNSRLLFSPALLLCDRCGRWDHLWTELMKCFG